MLNVPAIFVVNYNSSDCKRNKTYFSSSLPNDTLPNRREESYGDYFDNRGLDDIKSNNIKPAKEELKLDPRLRQLYVNSKDQSGIPALYFLA